MVDDIEIQEIDELVATARKAQQNYEARGSQEIFDLACQAVGWALMQPENNSELSKLAVSETCLLYTSPSPRDLSTSRMPSSA